MYDLYLVLNKSPQESLQHPMIHHVSLYLFILKENTIRSPSILQVRGKEEREGKEKGINVRIYREGVEIKYGSEICKL